MSIEEPLSFVRTRLTWQAYLTTSYYAYLMNSLGPMTPFLRDELGLSYSEASFHFSAFALGIILTGFLMNRGVQRLGAYRMVWIGVFGMASGTLLLLAGRTSAVTIAGAFLMGWLGSLISTLFRSALAEQHGTFRAVALVESTMIASLFAALAPLAVGFFGGSPFTWRAAQLLMLGAVPLLWLAYRKNRLGAHSEPARAAPAGGKKPTGGLPFTYWLYWALTFLVEAVEFCIIFWAAAYLETAIGFPKASAALGVSAFTGAMLCGRWLVSRLLRRAQEQRLVLISLIVALLGFLSFWLAPAGTILGGILAMAGLGVAGLGVAGLFPMINSLALASAPGRMVEASGLISLAVGTAIFLMPLLLARLADAVGIRAAYGLELAVLLASILLAGWAYRQSSRQAASG